jgi:transcriptional regulator with XRE-family HTH domain
MTITPGQVKAARRLLGWSQADLAGHVGVSAATVTIFEFNKSRSPELDLERTHAVLEAAGHRVYRHEERAEDVWISAGIGSGTPPPK